jgi:hypothetical protein
VGVVDEAIQDGVCESGIADDFMPGIDGDLAGDDGGCATMAVVEDFEQIAAFGGGEHG